MPSSMGHLIHTMLGEVSNFIPVLSNIPHAWMFIGCPAAISPSITMSRSGSWNIRETWSTWKHGGGGGLSKIHTESTRHCKSVFCCRFSSLAYKFSGSQCGGIEPQYMFANTDDQCVCISSTQAVFLRSIFASSRSGGV